MEKRTDKLEQVLVKLTEAAERQKAAKGQASVGEETLSDDAAVSRAAETRIKAQEEIVRPVLKLFGIDYDGLIGMQGKDGTPSVYAQAVQARPDLLQALMNSPTPVLAALTVAVGYQEFAAFSDKYGQTPDAIKAALKAEVLAEAGVAEAAPKAMPTDSGMALFSGVQGSRLEPKKRRGGSLGDVFGR